MSDDYREVLEELRRFADLVEMADMENPPEQRALSKKATEVLARFGRPNTAHGRVVEEAPLSSVNVEELDDEVLTPNQIRESLTALHLRLTNLEHGIGLLGGDLSGGLADTSARLENISMRVGTISAQISDMSQRQSGTAQWCAKVTNVLDDHEQQLAKVEDAIGEAVASLLKEGNNRFGVGRRADGEPRFSIMLPPREALTRAEAINLAAWLVIVAGVRILELTEITDAAGYKL